MTSKDIESELERVPFVPLRLHLASGKSMKIQAPNSAWLLQNALLVLRAPKLGKSTAEGYDVLDLRNIERIESLGSPNGRRSISR